MGWTLLLLWGSFFFFWTRLFWLHIYFMLGEGKDFFKYGHGVWYDMIWTRARWGFGFRVAHVRVHCGFCRYSVSVRGCVCLYMCIYLFVCSFCPFYSFLLLFLIFSRCSIWNLHCSVCIRMNSGTSVWCIRVLLCLQLYFGMLCYAMLWICCEVTVVWVLFAVSFSFSIILSPSHLFYHFFDFLCLCLLAFWVFGRGEEGEGEEGEEEGIYSTPCLLDLFIYWVYHILFFLRFWESISPAFFFPFPFPFIFIFIFIFSCLVYVT